MRRLRIQNVDKKIEFFYKSEKFYQIGEKMGKGQKKRIQELSIYDL